MLELQNQDDSIIVVLDQPWVLDCLPLAWLRWKNQEPRAIFANHNICFPDRVSPLRSNTLSQDVLKSANTPLYATLLSQSLVTTAHALIVDRDKRVSLLYYATAHISSADLDTIHAPPQMGVPWVCMYFLWILCLVKLYQNTQIPIKSLDFTLKEIGIPHKSLKIFDPELLDHANTAKSSSETLVF